MRPGGGGGAAAAPADRSWAEGGRLRSRELCLAQSWHCDFMPCVKCFVVSIRRRSGRGWGNASVAEVAEVFIVQRGCLGVPCDWAVSDPWNFNAVDAGGPLAWFRGSEEL
jgi:hypothetical protein